jgi:hypothetical protein
MTDILITPGTLANAIIFLITVTSFIFIVGSRVKKSVNKDDIDEVYKYIDKTTDALGARCDKIDGSLKDDVKAMNDKMDKIYDHLINKRQ